MHAQGIPGSMQKRGAEAGAIRRTFRRRRPARRVQGIAQPGDSQFNIPLPLAATMSALALDESISIRPTAPNGAAFRVAAQQKDSGEPSPK